MNKTRAAVHSLQISTEFDAFENTTIGGSDYECDSGVFTYITDTPAKNSYYCRSIYNSSASDVVVVFQVFDDSATYTARITSGQWFHAYNKIKTIIASGSTSATVLLAYQHRGKVDGTGTF